MYLRFSVLVNQQRFSGCRGDSYDMDAGIPETTQLACCFTVLCVVN